MILLHYSYKSYWKMLYDLWFTDEFSNLYEETIVILPTIGRVVLIYRPDSGSDQFESGTIQYVHNPNLIDVSLVTKRGPVYLEKIPLLHGVEGDRHPGPGEVNNPFACWMPYQREAARGHQPNPFAGRSF